MTMHSLNMRIGEMVSRLVGSEAMAPVLEKARAHAFEALRSDPTRLAGAISIPVDAFGAELPGELKSCRLSIMRGGAAYHVERHPNAVQYVYSLEHSGVICVLDGTRWETSPLVSDVSAPLSRRWHVVPANTWHQPIPGAEDWAVLGFHSVSAAALVDDFQFDGPRRVV